MRLSFGLRIYRLSDLVAKLKLNRVIQKRPDLIITKTAITEMQTHQIRSQDVSENWF